MLNIASSTSSNALKAAGFISGVFQDWKSENSSGICQNLKHWTLYKLSKIFVTKFIKNKNQCALCFKQQMTFGVFAQSLVNNAEEKTFKTK